MSIIDFIMKYWQEGLLYTVLGGGLIQISPLKWNPLSWVARKLGKALKQLADISGMDIDADYNLKKKEDVVWYNMLFEVYERIEDKIQNIKETERRRKTYCSSNYTVYCCGNYSWNLHGFYSIYFQFDICYN